jgi:hypothetical protein
MHKLGGTDMDWNSFFSGVSGGAVVTVAAGWVLKKWLGKHIDKSVELKYDKELESHRASLQKQVTRFVQEMQAVAEGIREQKEVDKELFDKFMEALPSSGAIEFVKAHDMAYSFDIDVLDSLYSFYDNWEKPEYCFLDEEIDQKRAVLHEKTSVYLKSLGCLHTYDKDFNATAVPREMKYNYPEEFRQTVKKLNDLGGEVVAAHEDLIKTAREKWNC